MSEEGFKEIQLPKADLKRLAELEALAKEHEAQFYTLEVSSGGLITLLHHSDRIYSKRIKGDPALEFDSVLDYALVALKAHVLRNLK